jgi:predicted GH43/DUF377 family glycosyl hydrolase
MLPNKEVTALAEAREYGVDLAYGRRVVSTHHTDDNTNTKAVDGNATTRYASFEEDNVYFYVDLGSLEKVGKVVIDWEAAFAAEYEIQLSLDAANWTTVANVKNTNKTIDVIEFPTWVEAKFVKFQGIKRATTYGYSFYSFEVYGPMNEAVGSEVTEVSSSENEVNLNKNLLVDNLADTRWASEAADNQYFIIDLKESKTFDMIKIRWEISFARRFRIYTHQSSTQPARDDQGWEVQIASDTGLGEVDSFSLKEKVTTRFIKVELLQRETSEQSKKDGRYPWDSTFSIYSFEIYDWNLIQAIPLGKVMEYSKNSPAWTAMNNITLNESGLIIAPIGSPREADGVVTNLESIKDGNIPGFESYGTYNPAVVYDEDRGMFHMIYRAELPDNFQYYFMSDNRSKYELGHMSTLAYAYSYDGVNFIRGENNPIAWPTSADEQGGGLEDPRMFKVVNDPNRDGKTTYYITYTMYDNSVTREGIIYTHDFITFHKAGRLAPDFTAYGGFIKSGTFVTDPEGNAVMINDPRPGKVGKVFIIYMKDGSYTRIGFTKDVLHINPEDIIDIDTGGFANNNIEALTKGNESCMALTNLYGEDDENIYLMYGGGRLSDNNLQFEQPNVNGWFYALGVLKTTKSNPFELTNVRMDLDEPTLHPTDTNKIDYGLFNKCMFADSMIRYNNQWFLYYGAGDMYIGLAKARGDFSASAADYQLENNLLTVSSIALNKKYGPDKSAYAIEFVSELYDLAGNKISEQIVDYSIKHFSHLDLGIYAKGEDVKVEWDLNSITNLPEQYYIRSYIRDAKTLEVINNLSSYAKISASVISTVKS